MLLFNVLYSKLQLSLKIRVECNLQKKLKIEKQ